MKKRNRYKCRKIWGLRVLLNLRDVNLFATMIASAHPFESVVKSEGCQSYCHVEKQKDVFESVVKSEGCQSIR